MSRRDVVVLLVLGLFFFFLGVFMAANPSVVHKYVSVQREVPIANNLVVVKPGQYYYWRFSVPPGSIEPALYLKISVERGGNRDLDLVVVSSGGGKIYSERIAGYAERSIQLPGPGGYELRLSNTFSLITSKQAYIEAKLLYRETVVKTVAEASSLAIVFMGVGLALALASAIMAYRRG